MMLIVLVNPFIYISGKIRIMENEFVFSNFPRKMFKQSARSENSSKVINFQFIHSCIPDKFIFHCPIPFSLKNLHIFVSVPKTFSQEKVKYKYLTMNCISGFLSF